MRWRGNMAQGAYNAKLTDIYISTASVCHLVGRRTARSFAAVSQFSHVRRQAVSGTTFFTTPYIMRSNTCIELAIGLQGAAMWLELLNAPSLAQFVIAPGRKDHSIVSFMAFRIIRGDMCWETSQNVRFEEMGLAQLDRSSFQPVWTWHHGASSL